MFILVKFMFLISFFEIVIIIDVRTVLCGLFFYQ